MMKGLNRMTFEVTDYDELRKLAEAAKAHDWYDHDLPSPDVILALLEERRVLREAARWVSRDGRALEHYGGLRWSISDEAFSALRQALQAEPARAEEGAGT